MIELDGVVAAKVDRLALRSRQHAVGRTLRILVEQIHLHLDRGIGLHRDRRHRAQRLGAFGRENVGRRSVVE